jgi:hypothetical protein
MRATAFKLIQSAPTGHMPQRIESEALSIHEARIEAIKRLGTGWVHHHAYVFNPRHSNDATVYQPARSAYFAEVARRAAADRARRPSFRRAQAVRAALESQS